MQEHFDLKDLFFESAQGNEQAFTKLFFHYNKKLYPFLLKKTQSTTAAEELLQDIFLKLWLNRKQLAEIDNPDGYIFRMAANKVLDFFRHQARQYKIVQLGNDEEAIAINGEDQAHFKETQKLVNEAIEQLPEQRRKIYKLKQQGLSNEEIGDSMDIATNTVKNQLLSANKFIRSYLTERGISPMLAMVVFNDFLGFFLE